MSNGEKPKEAEKSKTSPEDQILRLAEKLGLKIDKPLPKTHPNSTWDYEKLQTTVNEKGGKFYWWPMDINKDGKTESTEGRWYPEPLVKYWFFDMQVTLYTKDVYAVEAKIKAYEDEIARIDAALTGADIANLKIDVQRTEILKGISRLDDIRESMEKRGLRKGDPAYDAVISDLQKKQQELAQYTPSKAPYIQDWPEELGGKPVPNQNLHLLKVKHQSTIKLLEKTELKPLKEQLDRATAHRDFWKKLWFGETK